MHTPEERGLDVARHARSGDEREMAGGLPTGGKQLVCHTLIDRANPIHGHDRNVSYRGKGNKAWLLLVMDQAERARLGHGEVDARDAGLHLLESDSFEVLPVPAILCREHFDIALLAPPGKIQRRNHIIL